MMILTGLLTFHRNRLYMAKSVHSVPAKFTGPCSILEQLLASRGYKKDINSIEGPVTFCVGDKYYTGTEAYADVFEKSRKSLDPSFNGFVDCGEDIALFMMIAGLRNDKVDQWQVFINDADPSQTEVCSTVRWVAPGWHKASLMEIIQRFAPSRRAHVEAILNEAEE